MPWRPTKQGELPTLGWEVLQWIQDYLAAPDRSDYEPMILTKEQAAFILAFYQIDPATGKRRYRRAVYSRPKGAGKSPFLSAICCVEALGPVVPAGWDARGQPVGRPWSDIRTPWVQIAATSEDQSKNAWSPLLEMLRGGPVMDEYPGLEPMDTFVALPKGRIEFVTSAATSREGNRPVHVCLDQTESWTPTNGGVRLAATLRRNLGKVGGSSIEAPNAFIPGLNSVSEESARYMQMIEEGKARDAGLLYDHREWPATTEMSDRESLFEGLAYAYGDSAALPDGCRIHQPPCERDGWVDLDRLIAEIWDPATSPESSRQYYGNQVTHASDSWLSHPEWAACSDSSKVVADGDAITLGFDGSRKRTRGVTDATALMGCRVSDGHLFPIGVWEEPEGPAGDGWQVPVLEVLTAVEGAFARYNVVAFFADPAKWEGHVGDWEAEYGPRLKVKASRNHPVEWWMSGGRSMQIVRATERLHNAIIDREMTHDGSHVLTRHALNARRRVSRVGVQISKEHPDSANKIDAVVASILAWEARADSIATGVLDEPSEMQGFTFF